MSTLIVPCGGKSSRYPGMKPKWLLTHPDGYTAILLVKDRQKPEGRFSDAQLSLDLPAGVDVEPIKQGR